MQVNKTNFKDLYTISLSPFNDHRGTFSRLFCQKELQDAGIDFNIAQINNSFTKEKGSIRGLHFQNTPYIESKIIKCIKGKILDIVVDIRENSPTFLQYFSIELTEDNDMMLVIPKGFAHGFQTLSDDCEIIYFVDEFYNPQKESGLLYDDKILNIEWKLKVTDISKKDIKYKEIDSSFKGVIID